METNYDGNGYKPEPKEDKSVLGDVVGIVFCICFMILMICFTYSGATFLLKEANNNKCICNPPAFPILPR